jgi:hypothetical protein
VERITYHINTEYLNTDTDNEMSMVGDYLLDLIPYYDDFLQTVSYLTNTKLYVVNMQACNAENFALFKTFNDPGSMLKRLSNILHQARNNGDKLILVGGGRSPGSIRCNR